jgi:hypothetical protein
LEAKNGIWSNAASGASAAQSIFVVPSLKLGDPPLLARQFSNLVEANTLIARPLAACTSMTLASLAYMSWASSTSTFTDAVGRKQRWHLLALAAVFCFGITPFSATIILPINCRMKELAESVESKGIIGELQGIGEEDEVNDLVERWRKYNYVRCCFPLLGSLVAQWALLS